MVDAVIAEDEELLRSALVALLGEVWPQLHIVAECEDGASALERLAEHQPDVAFLDIRMPGLSGIEVARALGELSPRTQVVFVTAYDQYAIDAFEQGAVDYLLKPIVRERLQATVQRLQARAAQGPDVAVLDALLHRLGQRPPAPAAAPPLAWITANSGRETRLILLDDVVYFQADNKYTTVLTRDGEALLRTPLRELLDVLDPAAFRQIHRSTIVNLKAVASVVRDDTGKGRMKLRHRDEVLTVSQPYMSLFRGM
ncbi:MULTISPECIES: LytR/AlgR family response regulator transcription factor [Xanthomonas translucens group]|uniref:Two-component system response regulator n=3 Tax=Xanthomonas campestris pv. translucens TaxID=343 RepID=A0A120EY99_XANCT|nr:LytTR family DNA-binding domain-containing protein [Xanthomonas translucens]KTF35643.1 transcriptional regulator [Xanthomonas translucens pv. translucens]KWV14605.1 two-component system response regulator [Xanthomonas translucens]KWV15695.1 two-component system response regulator [Xanthomonas translucens]MCC8445023.1 LytTR family DNA-binding domain-containing protein [Xanthomonas translucens pv. translucens]MCS3358798.1 LytTR family DNA-binding domain-containing protein [Xanthomonas translu